VVNLSPVFQWFWYSDVRYSDPHCIPFKIGTLAHNIFVCSVSFYSFIKIIRSEIFIECVLGYKFLVGNRLSLADIELVVDLIPAFCSDQILVSNDQVKFFALCIRLSVHMFS
jgi:hypothetical protein